MNEQHGAGEDAGCYLASSSFLHFSYVFNIFFFLMFWKRDALITYDRETLTQPTAFTDADEQTAFF